MDFASGQAYKHPITVAWIKDIGHNDLKAAHIPCSGHKDTSIHGAASPPGSGGMDEDYRV